MSSAEQEMEIAGGEMRSAARQMDDAMRSYLSDLAELRSDVEKYRVEIEEEREDEQAKAEEKRIEREIREGRFGAGIKRLQERIDLQQTTMADILSGRDRDPSADALRELFGPTIEQAAAEERGETFPDPDQGHLPEPPRPEPWRRPDPPPSSGPRPDDYGTW
ncbi:MAG: hypothetical protein LCH60_15650 [Actinobacteria bacterium]|nr:hypothetical protein [Actinomycetota bacterium]